MNRREFLRLAAVSAIPAIAPGILQAAPVYEPEPERDYFPTGLPTLDRLLNGGIYKGQLGVIIGPCGCGKTTLLKKIHNTNFPASTTIYEDYDGSHDALCMWGKDTIPVKRELPFPSVVYSCVSTAHMMCNYDRVGNTTDFIRNMKRYVLETNAAFVMTMPVTRSPRSESKTVRFLTNFENFLFADFVISVKNTRKEVCLDIIKNRYGRRGRVRADFEVSSQNILMREIP